LLDKVQLFKIALAPEGTDTPADESEPEHVPLAKVRLLRATLAPLLSCNTCTALFPLTVTAPVAGP
jgi:hypothetical protein